MYGNDIQPVWGPLYGWTNTNGNVWKCNTLRVVSKGWVTPVSGAYSAGWVPALADNGKFWIPAAAYNSPVSATDYLGNTSCSSTPTPDTAAPTVPANLAATAASQTQINLTWAAATDNVGVAGYKVYRNGTQVGTPTGTSYSDTGLTAGTSYAYTVAAYDAAANVSAQSSSVSAVTQSSPQPTSQPTTIAVGARVQTTNRLNVRSGASVSAKRLCTQSLGAPGTIVGGPIQSQNHTWWQINYDSGCDGWSSGLHLAVVVTADTTQTSGVAAVTVVGPITHTLTQHWSGPEVSTLQSTLSKLGYFNTAITGYFGTDTAAAVAAFQQAHGLEPVGQVGPQTRSILNQQ